MSGRREVGRTGQRLLVLADSLVFHGPDGPWHAHRRVGHALADQVGELLPDAPMDH